MFCVFLPFLPLYFVFGLAANTIFVKKQLGRRTWKRRCMIDALSLVLSSMLFARTASNFNMSYCPSSMVDKNVKYIVKSSVLLKRLQFSKAW